jgi:hypothetical protein
MKSLATSARTEGRPVGKREAGGAQQGWRSYVLAMALCFLVGLLDLAAINWINLPPEARRAVGPLQFHPSPVQVRAAAPGGAADAGLVPPAAQRETAGARSLPEPRLARRSEDQLARLGGFLAFQGQAILAFTVAAGVLFVALACICLFVPAGRTRGIVLGTLGAEVAVAVAILTRGTSAMGTIAANMHCGAPADMVWDFCRRAWEQPQSFAFWAALCCTVAGGVAIFATFIVASTRSERPLPPLLGSRERCVTILIVAGSALLTSRMLLYKAFLEWAFADLRALERPSAALQNYLAGTATFNGALETSLLGVTWFVAVVLLQRGQRAPGGAVPAAGTAGGELSVFNLSAIFAPVLTALATNALGG